MAMPAGPAANTEAFERKREELEEVHLGRYVFSHEARFANAFDTAGLAITAALERFGVAPYLIRRVGAPREMRLPASLALGQNRAAREGGVPRGKGGPRPVRAHPLRRKRRVLGLASDR